MHIHEIFNAINANHHYEYFVVDHDYRIIEYSDKVFELCEVPRIDCKKRSIFDTVAELCGLEEDMERILKGKEKLLTIPYVFRGPSFYVHIHIHPGRKADASSELKYESLIILFENITEQAHMQQLLIQERNEKSLLLDEISQKNVLLKIYNEKMEELVAAEMRKNQEQQKLVELQSRHAQMGEMLAMITHQWKQPLNAINVIINVLKYSLKKNGLSMKQIEGKLDDVIRQVMYMNRTVMDFQEFFSPAREKVLFNLYDTVKIFFDLVEHEYAMQRITLELKGDKKVFAKGYPNEFNQVILTLLSNAKEAHLQHPKPDMWINVTIEREEENPCVIVTDNAGGIPEDVIDTIFDLYVTTKENGAGIGLNIAKQLVEESMEGRLYVRNRDEGAEFKVVFLG